MKLLEICLKRERDICNKPKLSGGKTGFRCTPSLATKLVRKCSNWTRLVCLKRKRIDPGKIQPMDLWSRLNRVILDYWLFKNLESRSCDTSFSKQAMISPSQVFFPEHRGMERGRMEAWVLSKWSFRSSCLFHLLLSWNNISSGKRLMPYSPGLTAVPCNCCPQRETFIKKLIN